MVAKFSIKVFENTTLGSSANFLFETEIERSFRIGRQETDEPEAIALVAVDSKLSPIDLKLVIAPASLREYSRNFAEVVIGQEKITVTNVSSNQQIYSAAASPINPLDSRQFAIPFEITLVNRTIVFKSVFEPTKHSDIRSLPESSPPSLRGTPIQPHVSLLQVSREKGLDGERLIELLRNVMQILQDSPGCQEFFDQAVKAIAQLLDLNHALIAFSADHKPSFGDQHPRWGRWHAQALCCSNANMTDWSPSMQILNLIERDRQTVYQIPDLVTESLVAIKSLVASPLKNSNNEVIGLIYGDRNWTIENQAGFLQTEAMFVELFANGISIGLERIRQERTMSQMRARFDQFFTPSLARQLEADASMLEPRSANVSILFADIRGFSRISERIGPEKTIHWINSVMSHLSDCVLRHEGVVVDYIGDEIMAMWGAPIDQENHAELAVRAGLAMIAQLPEINQQWAGQIGEPVDLGMGINSGEAQVGNTGSERKFKYGPLGDVVNISSRLQGATKQLRARILVTESTATALPAELWHRKIRSVRFVNVKRAVTVFEIPFQPNEHWRELKQEYEAGLEFYERGQLALASQKMASIVAQWQDDGPSMLLLSDAVQSMQRASEKFDPIWQLEQK